MSLYNYDEVTILGRAGRDAEMRYTPAGVAVTSFSVACDRSYKDKAGQLIKRTIWYRISIWGNFAETCSKIKKGALLFVKGQLSPDDSGSPKTFTKNDGTSAASFDVNANTVRFLSDKDDGGQGLHTAQVAEDDGGIPF